MAFSSADKNSRDGALLLENVYSHHKEMLVSEIADLLQGLASIATFRLSLRAFSFDVPSPCPEFRKSPFFNY